MVTVGAGEAGGGSRANQSPGSGSKQRATKGRERKSASLGHSWTGQVVNWRGTLAREDGIITLGICAMDKKASSKHMHAIMSRMDKKRFTVVLFGDDCILNKPVDKWPLCDVLIAFFSDGFPLDKAEQYVALRKPYSLNDLGMQRDMQDRRLVYAKLREAGVPIPKNVCVSRDNDNGDDENTLEEFDDHIVVNDVVINKPFVEKPVDADDHNIYIYYPMSAGGGSKRLFRKVQNRSSDFFADVNEVRRDGSYIYEEFVETQGTDVKVYTVGPNYGHAEARKSPALDGVVNRDSEGKEIRYPVILGEEEKDIASRVTLAFGQAVCGFDILRVQGSSYVCDVNGWSFVKNSRKYAEDCAILLMEFFEAAVKPRSRQVFSTVAPLLKYKVQTHGKHSSHSSIGSGVLLENVNADGLRISPPARLTPTSTSAASSRQGSPSVPSTPGRNQDRRKKSPEELRCVIAIIRHGDRTPKQKMKMTVSYPQFLAFYARHTANHRKDLKVKGKSELKEFLDVTVQLIGNGTVQGAAAQQITYKLHQIVHVLDRWEISGINRKLQLKPLAWETQGDVEVACELLLILKWGGELTSLGARQAMELGDSFRNSTYPDVGGGGLLRLHSTFRHDLKIKTSDEGRVMKTAAAFAKGFLELEGDLTPILVSLVHKERTSGMMLDHSGNKDIKKDMDRCKDYIKQLMDIDRDLTDAEILTLVPAEQISVVGALKKLRNPKARLEELLKHIAAVVQQLERLVSLYGDVMDSRISDSEREKDCGDAELIYSHRAHAFSSSDDGDGHSDTDSVTSDPAIFSGMTGPPIKKATPHAPPPNVQRHPPLIPKRSLPKDPSRAARGETILLMLDRWRKLYKDLYNEKKGGFNVTKIPDVHDAARYDCLHNNHMNLTGMAELYNLSKACADCVVPQEYGIGSKDKLMIGSKMCSALMEKIKYDLIIARSDNEVDMRYNLDLRHAEDLPINSLGRRVRTRLYFTSESHLHTLLNVLRFPIGELPCLVTPEANSMIARTNELCYLTSFVIRLFEDLEKSGDDPSRFRVEILFTPGVVKSPVLSGNHLHTAPLAPLHKQLTCTQVEAVLDAAIALGAQDCLHEAASEHMEKIMRPKLPMQVKSISIAKQPQIVDHHRVVRAASPTRERIKKNFQALLKLGRQTLIEDLDEDAEVCREALEVEGKLQQEKARDDLCESHHRSDRRLWAAVMVSVGVVAVGVTYLSLRPRKP